MSHMQQKQKSKNQSVSTDKILKNYQNKKQLTKTIYPNQFLSLNPKTQSKIKFYKNKKEKLSSQRILLLPSEKYFGLLPEPFKKIESNTQLTLESLSQNLLRRKAILQKKHIELMGKKHYKEYKKINRRKLKQASESTNEDSVIHQKSFKTIQFPEQNIVRRKSIENNQKLKIISERKVKSGNQFIDKQIGSHLRIKTEKYEQLNLKNLIYDDQELTMSQKNCLKSFAKRNIDSCASNYQSIKEKSPQKIFKFKIHKQKLRQMQHNDLSIDLQEEELKVNQGWKIKQSNASIF